MFQLSSRAIDFEIWRFSSKISIKSYFDKIKNVFQIPPIFKKNCEKLILVFTY